MECCVYSKSLRGQTYDRFRVQRRESVHWRASAAASGSRVYQASQQHLHTVSR